MITRPTWTELRKLSRKNDFDAAAECLFGYEPQTTPGANRQSFRADQYHKRLGIDIHEYEGFFAEVGYTDAPEGPVTPATERLPIRPILAIRQSRRGHYYVRGLEFADGLFNREKTRAWIKTEAFDRLLGDDYFEKVEQQLAEAIEQAAASESKRPVQILDLGSLDERERAIFDKLRAGTDFADLSSSERELIAEAMQARQPKDPE